jgi:hypothetical protein
MIHKFEVRKFNSEGLKAFASLLEIRPTRFFPKLFELSQDPSFSEGLGYEMSWDSSDTSRLGLAEALWEVLGVGAPLEREAADPQVWNWISCRLFSAFHNGNESAARSNLKEKSARWIMEENSLRQHRHRVSGPFVAYKNNHPHVERALSQLVQDILTPGEVVERISGKIELAQGQVALLSTWLYVEPNAKKIRDGITGEGTPQQLSKYFNQIQKTVDYESMDAKSLLDMLPSTFSKWVNEARTDYPASR